MVGGCSFDSEAVIRKPCGSENLKEIESGNKQEQGLWVSLCAVLFLRKMC